MGCPYRSGYSWADRALLAALTRRPSAARRRPAPVITAALIAPPVPGRPALRADRGARGHHGRAECHRAHARRPRPDLTVLALTITGIAADSALAGATGAEAARRLISVVAMLLGALVGARLVPHAHIVYPLVVVLLILVAAAVTGVARSRATGSRAPQASA